jgi:hypothetical protein
MARENEFLEPDQLEDYRDSFRDSGFSPDDFELVQQRDSQQVLFTTHRPEESLYVAKLLELRRSIN